MKKAAIIIGKIFLGILSFILCVLLFVSTLATMLVADVKVATNKDNLANLIKNTLSAPVQPQLGPVSAAAGAEFDISSGDISGALIEFAYQALAEEFGDEMPVSLEDAKKFIADSTIKDFVAEKSASIISDIYTGENTTTFSSAEVKALLKENQAAIQKYFNISLTEEQIDALSAVVDQIPVVQQAQKDGIANVIMGNSSPAEPDNDPSATASPDDEDSAPPVSTPSNPLNDVLETVRTFTSTPVLLGLIGICLVLLGLLFLCAWSKPYNAMIVGGIPVSLAGLIFLVPTVIAWAAPATWMELMSFEPIVGPISRFILLLTASVCIAVTVLGAALIAGGIVLGCFMRKWRKAKAETPAIEEALVEEIPVEEAPAEEIPAEETPVEEIPAEETPVAEEVPAE